MQTKMLVKKPEAVSSKTNNPVNNNHKNKPAENKKNVRTTDYKKLLQIMLNDPDAITREEFLFLQSIIGYRRAVTIIRREMIFISLLDRKSIFLMRAGMRFSKSREELSPQCS